MARPVSQTELSDDELRDYAGRHVYYEIDMFIRSVDATPPSAPRHEKNPWPENVAFEELALHLRNLLDFFYSSGNRQTDVCAKHFFSPPDKWKAPNKTDLLDRSHQRASKLVMHLTTAREPDPSKDWDIQGICDDLAPVIEKFAKTADLVPADFESRVLKRLGEINV